MEKMTHGFAALAMALLASSCGGDASSEFKVGGLHSVKDGEGRFKIAKVLVVEEGAIHLRLYKNTFPARPDKVDPSSLTLGSIKDKDGFGVGHLPLALDGFKSWDPVLLMETTVSPEELEGYRIWKEGAGGAPK